jgi:predicted O-methyltransferase YrrM
MFDKLIWLQDRMLLNGLIFRLQHTKSDNWDSGDGHFIFYKIKKLIDQYETYFKNYPENASPKNVIEIGMWDGGSVAFWNEILKPNKIVGIDIIENGGNNYFQEYLKTINEKNPIIIPNWGTDQSDAQKIRKIVAENFGSESIDLVFDDGSHMYAQTLASFNALFPLIAKGGIYIIEDWAWSHWPDQQNDLPVGTEPTKLVHEIVQAAANVGLIESVSIFEGFIVVKRGQADIKGNIEDFSILNYIYNRPLNFKSKVKSALRIFGLYN